MAVKDDEGQHGYVYLVCFSATPLAHARHYLGATGLELDARMAAHRGEDVRDRSGRPGRPARILAALQQAGGRFDLVRSWKTSTREQAFELERRLKLGAPSSGAYCPWCRGLDDPDRHAQPLTKTQRPLVIEESFYTPDGKVLVLPREGAKGAA